MIAIPDRADSPFRVISGRRAVSDRMSALPPKADIKRLGGNVRFVPEGDIAMNPIR